MQLFYSNTILNDTLVLDEAESRHAVKVLRKHKGDEIQVMDGAGGLYSGILIADDSKKVEVRIENHQYFDAPGSQLRIAIAPTKNMDRMEWMVEKATEIGVSEIQFILTKRSERRRLKLDRLEKIALSAAKQSGTWHLPTLGELISLDDFFKRSFDEEEGLFIATLGKDQQDWRSQKLENLINWVLIGPEGDFHLEELEKAKAQGFVPLSLGEKRLRTETAAIQVCSWFAFLS